MTDAELNELIERYEALVWTVVHGILPNFHDCEEVCADVFVSLWKSDFDPSKIGAKSFIITLSKRRAVDHLRRFGGSNDELEDLDSGLDLEDEVASKIDSENIAAVINSLPPPDDEIFTRRYYYNQRIKQIASDLGLTAGYVKSRLERAKDDIRKKLSSLGIK